MAPVDLDLPDVPDPDVEARRAAVARHAELAVPPGGLGELAELGVWLAAAQGKCPPAIGRARLLVVAADHGIAAAGVSVGRPTAEQVAALREQSAPVSALAPVADVSVRVVDVAVDTISDDRFHVRESSGRIDREDALTAEEAHRAFEAGRALADEEVDAGADLLIPASAGRGATTAASALIAIVTGAEPVAVIGRGSGIDDDAWMRKCAAVRDARRRAKPYLREPLELLRVIGGADLAVLTGLILQASVRRTPVLLDGVVVAAAAMLAYKLASGARQWWLAAQRSPEPAVERVLERLDLTPLLDLRVHLGDGSGAAAAVPLVRMAAALLA
jgi:nicotinate-nucleotide--dimethylbenzimidazole phosphoribosyltransferase